MEAKNIFKLREIWHELWKKRLDSDEYPEPPNLILINSEGIIVDGKITVGLFNKHFFVYYK